MSGFLMNWGVNGHMIVRNRARHPRIRDPPMRESRLVRIMLEEIPKSLTARRMGSGLFPENAFLK